MWSYRIPSMKMRALHFTAPKQAQVVDRARPVAAADEALVAPAYVGLCGTDAELFAGSMPYFKQGLADYPLQPGHEVSGVVVSSPAADQAPGQVVVVDPVIGCGICEACRSGPATRCPDRRELGVRRGMPGGAAELIAVPTTNLHPVPAGLDPRDAVLAEPGVTVLNAVLGFGAVAGRRAAVIGAGTLGLIAAQLLSSRGAEVEVLVARTERRPLVERLRLRPVQTAADCGYDLVVEAAGQPEAVRSALRAVAPGGQVALTGVPPEPVDGFDASELVLKDATLRGVLNGPGLYRQMLDELASGAVDAATLIDAEYGLEDGAAALAALRAPDRPAPKVVLRIGGSFSPPGGERG
jgi:2-desacetyl-2-hydroxyethyl bacteriochlorophyllide A dehydrogenase